MENNFEKDFENKINGEFVLKLIVEIIPKADGLKTCFFPMRKIYLEKTVRNAASRLVYQ